MNQDELRLLTDLANKIAQTPTPARDPEADTFIRTRIGNRPDALYLMTQTVLIQNMALEQAQAQISDLQRAASSGAPGRMGMGSFLGQQPGASPGQGQPQPQPQYQPQYAPQQSQYVPAGPMPAAGMGSGSGSGGFLKGAAQTAAGIAAGALAFEGIRSLFSHPFGGGIGGFGGGSGFLGGGGMPVEETVVNNYYGSPGGEGHHGQQLADSSDVQDYSDQDTDQQDDGGQLQDADYEDSDGIDYDDSSSGSDDSSDVA